MKKVLLLPGMLNDASLFQEQIATLLPIASVDIVDLTRSSSIADLADDAIKQAPEGRFILIGLSMGGYVAFEIMRRIPERVCGLILIDTSAQPDTAELTATRQALMKLAETDFPEVIERLLPRLCHPEQMSLPTVRGVIQSMAASLGKDVFIRHQQAIIDRSDSRPMLADIDCPTLVICGREDVITPPELSKEIAAGIRHAELKIIEQCGHLSTLDQPGEVNKLLHEWIDKVEC
jgi:pimeloyl-ACP methyl ester carboxylesterase